MNKSIKKDIKKYCSEIKKILSFSCGVKFAFISEFKSRIYEYIEEHPDEDVTIADIKNQFGSPESIALSFSATTDMEVIRKKAKKYIIYKVMSVLLVILLIVVAIILYKVLFEDSHIIVTNDF